MQVRTPWHVWVVGALMLLWSLLAAYDHVSSMARGEEYFRASGMSDAQVAYFLGQPPWALAVWTASVWGGLLAALALLLRRKEAPALFAVAFGGTALYALYTLGLSAGREAMGMLWMMPLVFSAVTLLLTVYARTLRRRGVIG